MTDRSPTASDDVPGVARREGGLRREGSSESRLPEAVRRLLGRLETRVLHADPAGSAEDSLAEDFGELRLRDVWIAVESLRRDIDRRDDADAAILHRRLDVAALEIAESFIAAQRQDHRRLLSEVSHDLRSPMNSILFVADALQHGRGGELDSARQRQVKVIYTAALSLVRMVNDLVDFGRLGRIQELSLHRARVKLPGCMSEVVDLLGPLTEQRGVTLEVIYDAATERIADREVLTRVLLNLICNAIDASDEGMEVTVWFGEAADGWLRLRVTDRGRGVEAEQVQRIMDSWSMDAPTDAGAGWTRGLGLRICGRLVSLAGGEVRVDSDAGEGTMITIDLPFPSA